MGFAGAENGKFFRIGSFDRKKAPGFTVRCSCSLVFVFVSCFSELIQIADYSFSCCVCVCVCVCWCAGVLPSAIITVLAAPPPTDCVLVGEGGRVVGTHMGQSQFDMGHHGPFNVLFFSV